MDIAQWREIWYYKTENFYNVKYNTIYINIYKYVYKYHNINYFQIKYNIKYDKIRYSSHSKNKIIFKSYIIFNKKI